MNLGIDNELSEGTVWYILQPDEIYTKLWKHQ